MSSLEHGSGYERSGHIHRAPKCLSTRLTLTAVHSLLFPLITQLAVLAWPCEPLSHLVLPAHYSKPVCLLYAGTVWGVTVSASTRAPTPGRSY